VQTCPVIKYKSVRYLSAARNGFPVFKYTEFTSNGVRPAFKYSSTSVQGLGWLVYRLSATNRRCLQVEYSSTLANDLRIPLVCAGTQEARTALLTDEQLADRFEAFELSPWKDDTDFHQLLVSYAALLPLRRPSRLRDAKLRKRLLAMTDGVTVRICRLLEDAAVMAINRSIRSIETLNKSMWTVFMTILRCNPWLPSRIAANGVPPGPGHECLFTNSTLRDCHLLRYPFPEESLLSWICRFAAAASIILLVSAQYSPS
jgi:Bacterial TniB protein